MNEYSLTQEDYETILEVSEFKVRSHFSKGNFS